MIHVSQWILLLQQYSVIVTRNKGPSFSRTVASSPHGFLNTSQYACKLSISVKVKDRVPHTFETK